MASTRDEFRSNFDKLKPFITDPYLKIEPKGINPYTIDNIGNYILCSNHIDSIILEESDRRYAIFQVSNKYRQNTEYFENLTKQCYTQTTADAFYSYLLNFDEVDIHTIPNTKARQEIMNISKPNAIKFLDFLKEEPLTRFNQETSEVENIKEMKATELYEKYRNWCNQNGERNIVSNTKFGLILKDKIERKRNKLGNVYVLGN
jgi:phage/plasmid-associated DNA primase